MKKLFVYAFALALTTAFAAPAAAAPVKCGTESVKCGGSDHAKGDKKKKKSCKGGKKECCKKESAS